MRRKWLLAVGMFCGACLVGLGIFVYAVLSGLPHLQTLADYQPPRASKVYAADGVCVGVFGSERRTLVQLRELPPHVVHAFLAAEDAGFYQHEGIDYWGIVRAMVKNLRPGAHLQGASTITQQTVKTLVLGPERSYRRKVREAYLARHLERMLGKDAILTLYLNQIYFGNGAWGVGEASLHYFGKPAAQLGVGEAALLAAVVKNPNRLNLRADLRGCKLRQRYVLLQMQQHGWLGADTAAAASAEKLPYPTAPVPSPLVAPDYLEHVRRLLVAQVGEEKLLTGGLRIEVGMHSRMQQAAQVALRQGLLDVALRLGSGMAAGSMEPGDRAEQLQLLHAEQDRQLGRLQSFADAPAAPAGWAWDLGAGTVLQTGTASAAALRRTLNVVPLAPFVRLRVPVVQLSSAGQQATVDLGCSTATVALQPLAWARRRRGAPWLRPGDLVDVEVVRAPRDGKAPRLRLLPPVVAGAPQAALVAIEPQSREVRALVGGMPTEPGGFNRATQALRQPGSAFKPMVYAAALQMRLISPASICLDAPVAVVDRWTGKTWRPENYESGRYDGAITYRRALSRSVNTCSVALVQKLGPKEVVRTAHALGIEHALPENLTLALGTGETTVVELTNAYTTLAAGGQLAPPRFIRTVHTPQGEQIWPAALPSRLALASDTAYVLTHMLQSVVAEGTGARAQMLGRALAGKSGTSQQARNVWFSGYAPQLVASVWMGYDDNRPMGRLTGASAALPAWIRFMGMALASEPALPFVAPGGIRVVRVDPVTGVHSDATQAIDEVFLSGTAPNAEEDQAPSIYLQEE